MKETKPLKLTKKKARKKVNKLNLWAIIITCLDIFAVFCVAMAVIVIIALLKNKPTLNLSDFDQSESSVIYDQNGEEIANLGTVIRQNVEYEEIPNVVVDAFVAVEDSRFFEHNGFDLPRFVKAMISNIISMDFGQGGSTFTMQLVKNTYFVNDETGTTASRSGVSGIRRKVQEISLAMELETYQSKQFIFESYVNKLNFGGDNNIRGIQKAAQYYFSKDVSELNINEAALLAGVINAPNYYNPFYNLEAAQAREEEVLYLMHYHGYISDTEYALALSVRVEDLLQDPYSNSSSGEGIPYQAYIDYVVNEVIELTGLDPYTNTMHIYTYMNKDIQSTMDAIQADLIMEEDDPEESYMKYPDEYYECASVCIDNATGQIVGILGGRNYADGGQLLLNHATEQYKQPGSSIKPILDYALAFENLGWATDHVLTDAPQYMDSSKTNLVYNDNGKYIGDVTLADALGKSINTCAIQTLQAVLDKMKYEYVVDYANSLGYEFDLDKFNVQYGVGGSTCEVTPLQHAAAYAALMNYGTYNEPHTVKRIEFVNGKSPITPTYESKEVLSPAAAYLTTELMKSNVNNYGGSYSYVKNNKYQVYAKTGTTDWGFEGAEYGIPVNSIKDCWLVAATSEYTTATWCGYEKAVLGQPSYVDEDTYYDVRPQARIAHLLLEACYEYGDSEPVTLSQPSGVTSITHILGTWPYASIDVPGVNLDQKLITTGLIKSDSASLVSLSSPTIEAKCEDVTCEILGERTSSPILSVVYPEYPDEEMTQVVGETRKQDLELVDGTILESEGTVLFDYTWIYGSIKYACEVTITYSDGTTKTDLYESSSPEPNFTINDISKASQVDIEFFYKYDNSDIRSTVNTSYTKKITEATIPALDSKDIEDVIAWCNENGINFTYEITSDSSKDRNIVCKQSSGESYDYSKSNTVKTSTTINCTYYIYLDITGENEVIAGNSLVLTINKGKSLSSYSSSKCKWTYKLPNNYKATEENDNLIIIVPAKASAGSIVITYTVNDTYSVSQTINIKAAE